jgi:hypothetical protein
MAETVQIVIWVLTRCSIAGGCDVSQEHVLSLVRVEGFKSKFDIAEILASCKEGCNLNQRRRGRSFSHFLSHCSWWHSWFRHCATRWNVVGSIPEGVIGIIH